jgi:hypothetical protein
MITVPTHKRHKTPSEHSKTIYVFTSGRVIVIVQIHSTKKDFEWVKMATAKMDINNSGAQQDSRFLAARFNEKACLQVWGGDALRPF